MKQKLSIALLLLAFSVFAKETEMKLIDLSWWNPTVDYLEKHLKEMQKTVPLDGLTMTLIGTPQKNGHIPQFCNAWQNVAWNFENCEDYIRRYNRLDLGRFTDNFLYLTTNNAYFDWFSDQDWEIVAHNFGVAAKVARLCNMKGFLFDIEQYGIRFWDYDEKTAGRPFSEAAAIAFIRGQQWGNEVFNEFPDIILFMPYALRHGNEAKDTCLANAFLNGMIDVMPETALIFEGIEDKSYFTKNKTGFENLLKYLDYEIENDIYPKNRHKGSQLKLSPGLFLDSLILEVCGNEWLQPELNNAKNKTEFLCNVIKEAANVAYRQYVWLYGERRSWWPVDGCQGLWGDAPGMNGLLDELMELNTTPTIITLSANNTDPANKVILTAESNKEAPILYNTQSATYPGTWSTYTEPITVTKNCTYYFKSTDAAGNVGKKSITFANIDTTPPAITLTADTKKLRNRLPLTAKTETGITLYYNTVSEEYAGEWTPYSGEITVTENGTYFFKATDPAGNTTVKSITFTNIDNIVPALTLTADTVTPLQSATLTAAVDKAKTSITYNAQSADYKGKWTVYSGPITVNANATYYFKASDAAGNIGTNSITFANIDNTPPEKPSLSKKLSGAVILLAASWDAEDASCWYSLDDGNSWTEYTAQLTARNGERYLFRTEDAAGNQSESVPCTIATEIKAGDITVLPGGDTSAQVAFSWGDDISKSWPGGIDVAITTDEGRTVAVPEIHDNGAEIHNLDANGIAISVKPAETGNWTDLPQAISIVPPSAILPSIILQAAENDLAEIFFAREHSLWQNGYHASHAGNLADAWEGTGEVTPLRGKNKIEDLFSGSNDTSILILTDYRSGDALFLDDEVSRLPLGMEGQIARLSKINEIWAGAGNDIIDLTSNRLVFTGPGITVHGGLGNDIIWSGTGSNTLFGDAGDDRIVGASGDDIIAGGIGNDSIHCGGGKDIVCFCSNWGEDRIEQLQGNDSRVTLWFADGISGTWNPGTRTYTAADGKSTVSVTGIDADHIDVIIGDELPEEYRQLLGIGAFEQETSTSVKQ